MTKYEILLDFLASPYRDGGRGHDGTYDCWGLTRDAKFVLYGGTKLPEYGHVDGAGGRDALHRGLHRGYLNEKGSLQETDPAPGAIAAVFRKGLCVHVALVVEDYFSSGLGVHVLETNPKVGPRIIQLSQFLKEHYNMKVYFYDYTHLPEHP